jgi:hypothetical protein
MRCSFQTARPWLLLPLEQKSHILRVLLLCKQLRASIHACGFGSKSLQPAFCVRAVDGEQRIDIHCCFSALQVNTKPFLFYWERDPLRSSPFPLPIDEQMKLNSLFQKTHQSIPGMWVSGRG